MEANGIAPCPNPTSAITLHIPRQPVADAGPNGVFCQNTTYTISGSSASNYTGLTWSHDGTGNFNNSTFLHPVYTPGPGESGVVNCTLTVNAAPPCTDVIDFLQFTIDPTPQADAGPNGFICEGSDYTITGATAANTTATGIHWTETGTGSFTGANTISPTYHPGPGETGQVFITLVVDGALSCSGSTDSDGQILTISPFPSVAAGSDATICAANTYSLSESGELQSLSMDKHRRW